MKYFNRGAQLGTHTRSHGREAAQRAGGGGSRFASRLGGRLYLERQRALEPRAHLLHLLAPRDGRLARRLERGHLGTAVEGRD